MEIYEDEYNYNYIRSIISNKRRYFFSTFAVLLVIILLLQTALIITLSINYKSVDSGNNCFLNFGIIIKNIEFNTRGNLNYKQTSGICLDEQRETYFVVEDRKKLVEYNEQLEFLDYYVLENSEDLEGVTCLGDGNFVVIDEKVGKMRFYKINGENKMIEYRTIDTNLGDDSFGLEGITYDSTRDVFYLVREKYDTSVFTVSPLTGIVEKIFDVTSDYATDLSGIYYDLETDTILICSDESATVLHFTIGGELIGYFSEGHSSLTQTEGITMDLSKNHIILVGEKDEYAIFNINWR